MNSTGYLKTATAGVDSITNSRTAKGCFRSSVGLMRTARIFRPSALALATPFSNFASESNFLPLVKFASDPASSTVASLGFAGSHRNGFDGNRLVEYEGKMIGRAHFLAEAK